jgi:hypothetical protein
MTKQEIGKLLAYVAGACPSQKMNDLTGDAWHDILGHLEYEDARAAVRVVGARQPFISPSEIITEIAAKRSPEQPHSQACRGQDHRNCLMSWCMCVCHPRAVQTLAGPPPYEPDGPKALPAGPKRYDPGQLSIGQVIPDE